MIEESVSETDMVVYIMNGLGPSYGPLMTVITTRSEKINLDELHGMLLNFEQRLIRDNESNSVRLEYSIAVN